MSLKSVWYYRDLLSCSVSYVAGYLFPSVFGMAANLSPVSKLERLSPLVYRVLGCNPGPFTLQGTNTYLVGNGKRLILVDTGEPNYTEYTDNLSSILHKEFGGATIDTIICTHWHQDHVGGFNDVVDKVLGGKNLKLKKFKRHSVNDEPKFAKNGYDFIGDNHTFTADGATIRTVFTPGHTEDHIALYLEEENAVFSADCVLGEGTTVFEDLYTYMNSLTRLLEFKPSRMYPGHGPVIDNPVTKINEYIAHRNERERQILQFLQQHSTDTSSSMDIVNGVYEGIPAAVRLAAASNVKHHLSKLLKEGKVIQVKNDEWRIAASVSETSVNKSEL